jgi:hypothetical protein
MQLLKAARTYLRTVSKFSKNLKLRCDLCGCGLAKILREFETALPHREKNATCEWKGESLARGFVAALHRSSKLPACCPRAGRLMACRLSVYKLAASFVKVGDSRFLA